MRPVGSVPLASVNVAAPMPPVCVKVWLNGASTVPLFVAGLVTVMVWQAMVERVGRRRAGAAVRVGGLDGDRERAGLRRRAGEDARASTSVSPVGSVPLLSVKVVAPIAAACVKVWLKAVLTVPVFVAGL